MLRPRIIPCLLVTQQGLVKTVRFAQPKYVGDPINAVKIFNEKEVDELAVFDIEASSHEREPNYELIRKLAVECRMPLCYGGGIKTVDQVVRTIKLGVEKVAVSSAAIANPELVTAAATHVGSQSVVVVLDIRRNGDGRWETWIENGRKNTGLDPIALARKLSRRGAGEITLNSIDRDGTMDGYDLELARKVREAVDVPITVLGGAGSLEHIGALFDALGVVGAAAGSLFVFKGSLRAVLINYPARAKKLELSARAQHS